MNTAIILAGGIGSRLGANRPKQYIEVNGRPIISYCLDTFENNQIIDEIIIVVSDEWLDYVSEIVSKLSKFSRFAPAGSSRQHSIFNGLKFCDPRTESVIIHDAARPNVSNNLIDECFACLNGYDGVMPVIPVKDTIYYSEDGDQVNSLLNRDHLFAGQSPECFNYDMYYTVHKSLSENDLALIKGSSEIAFMHNMRIKMIKGDESNYKITTLSDLEKFKQEVKKC